MSRSLTPSPDIQNEEFHEDSEECDSDALALPTPAQLEDRLLSIQSKRSRSSTLTLKNMYGREPGDNDNDGPESDDEEAQYQRAGSSDWEL